MLCLPDINVWLALVFEAHRHHGAARAWFEPLEEEACAFCRFTQMGFLRLASNPAAFPDDALGLSEAWTCYGQLCGDPRVLFVPEPVGLEHLWRTHSAGKRRSPAVWNDAYLAAFGAGAGMTVVSFDRGFRAYRDLNCLIL